MYSSTEVCKGINNENNFLQYFVIDFQENLTQESALKKLEKKNCVQR